MKKKYNKEMRIKLYIPESTAEFYQIVDDLVAEGIVNVQTKIFDSDELFDYCLALYDFGSIKHFLEKEIGYEEI